MLPNSKAVKRYVILSEAQPKKLQLTVEQHITKGFQPYGSVLVHGGQMHQVMVVFKGGAHFLALVDKDADTSHLQDTEV